MAVGVPAAVFGKAGTQEERLGPFSDWSAPVNLGSVVNSQYSDFHPGVSRDELSLYFTSDRPGGVGPGGRGREEIWVTRREGLGAPWGPPRNLGPMINTAGSSTGVPNLAPDGRRLFFGSDRPGGFGSTDLWVARRDDPKDDFAWKTPVNLGSAINSSGGKDSPVFFEDRETRVTTLYFTRFDGPGGSFETPDENWNIYVSKLRTDGSFGPGVRVPELNSLFRNTRMAVRSDGLEMFLTSNRPGGIGPDKLNLNIWVSTRARTRDRWSTPVDLGSPINVGASDRGPALSFDGTTLYFGSRRPGGSGATDLWMTTRAKLPK
jgi:Tol biopolymer transport system component